MKKNNYLLAFFGFVMLLLALNFVFAAHTGWGIRIIAGGEVLRVGGGDEVNINDNVFELKEGNVLSVTNPNTGEVSSYDIVPGEDNVLVVGDQVFSVKPRRNIFNRREISSVSIVPVDNIVGSSSGEVGAIDAVWNGIPYTCIPVISPGDDGAGERQICGGEYETEGSCTCDSWAVGPSGEPVCAHYVGCPEGWDCSVI